LDVVRFLPALRTAGYRSLTITYRNDPGAPEDPSGRLRYGLTEWEDLEAAVRYALDEGARDVAMYGDSMGGGVIAAFLQRSKLASSVSALVLDAPMLNFSQTVDDNASREPLIGPIKLPSSLTAVAKRIAAWRYGVDWGALDYLATPEIYDMPILVFHGTADTTVPIGTSEELHQLRPDTVTLVRCQDANHIECWNLDPGAFDRRMVGFLDRSTST
jgi:alpha-beta hydrolase superfamily lysophospholipase